MDPCEGEERKAWIEWQARTIAKKLLKIASVDGIYYLGRLHIAEMPLGFQIRVG